MRHHPAFTLIETMIVIGLVALLSSMVLFYFGNIKNNQALSVSADEVKIVINRAHIYAREAKDEQSWGIRILDGSSYEIISGSKKSFVTDRGYKLESPTTFQTIGNEIWFDQGTGETKNPTHIILKNPQGRKIRINISKLGIVNQEYL